MTVAMSNTAESIESTYPVSVEITGAYPLAYSHTALSSPSKARLEARVNSLNFFNVCLLPAVRTLSLLL